MKSVRLFVGVSCLAALAATIFAAGCGSSAGGSSRTSTTPVISKQAKLDPCSLLGKDDVAGVIGQKVADPKRSGTSCSYDSSGASKKFQSLLVVAQAGNRDDFNYQKKVLGGGKARNVVGIGDAAAFLTNTQIVVLKHNVLINITGFGIPGNQLQTLAKKAADQVQG